MSTEYINDPWSYHSTIYAEVLRHVMKGNGGFLPVKASMEKILRQRIEAEDVLDMKDFIYKLHMFDAKKVCKRLNLRVDKTPAEKLADELRFRNSQP